MQEGTKMLRKMGIAIALASGLTLGGCVTTGSNSPVQQVLDGVRFGCSFAPLASAVEALLRGGTSISEAISSICAALNTQMSSKRMAARVGSNVTVRVRGIAIPGKIVR